MILGIGSDTTDARRIAKVLERHGDRAQGMLRRGRATGRAADASGGAGTGCVGQTEFEVPATVPVIAQMPGDASMLKAGTKVSITGATGADGTPTASRIAT